MHPRIRKPEVENLKKYACLMTKNQRITFGARYGNILKLLELNVQVDVISTVIQFYDSPMRCFTFQNFQLAPTLEEFARISGYPIEDVTPYQHTLDFDCLQEVAAILKDEENEVRKAKLNRNGIHGFPLEYFEKK